MANIEFSHDIALLAEKLKGFPAVFIIADKKIQRYITEPLVESLAESGVAVRGLLNIKVSERRKNFRTVEKIVGWLVDVGADRDALVLAVGGGITGDLAGFAACVYKRGVRYAVVPTTLLAQVDASVGGKTGCNVGGYKNMAGVIHQPEFTFINTDYLRTLPWREYLCGYAEMLKTFIIGDAAMYRQAVVSTDPGDLEKFVRRAVEIKAAIVKKDEQDRGERHILNLGHTFAHAIESRSAGSQPHGLAVAIGVVMAARLSEKEGIAAPGLAAALEADFKGIGLPYSCRWNADELSNAIRKDKKAVDGGVDFVLIREIGHCEIVRLKV